MFQQIVVPLDGSEQAEQALVVAARLARRSDGVVTLIQVIGAGAARGSDAVPVRSGNRTAPGDRQSVADYLQRLRERPELVGVTTHVVVRDGSPAEQIVAEVEQRGADLVVLSHHHHGAGASLVFGSVADDLMRSTYVPVLVLHTDDATKLIDAASRPVRALASLDGSTFAEQAIPRAIELLRALETGHGTALHLTYVLDPKLAYRYDQPETETMSSTRAYLARVAEHVTADQAAAGVEVSWAVETDPEVVAGIWRVAEQGAYLPNDYFDFVAMATHGRAGFIRWLAGSVTTALEHHVHLPVLVVRPRHEQTTDGSQRDGDEVTEQVPWMPLF